MASLSTYVTSVWYRISQGKDEASIGIYRAAIEQSLDSALDRLGQQVSAADPATRARLQKSYSLTLTTGDVAVSATMVTGALPSASLYLSGTTEPLQYLPNYQDLLAGVGWAADYVFFNVHEGKIKVRDYSGAIPSSTSLTVYTSYTPLVAEVPDDFADILYSIGVELVLESIRTQTTSA